MKNKGVGDYIIIILLSAINGFERFGLEWFGMKVILYVNVIIIAYAVLVYFAVTIGEKFSGK